MASLTQHVKSPLKIIQDFVSKKYPKWKEYHFSWSEDNAPDVLFDTWRNPHKQLEYFLNILESQISNLRQDINSYIDTIKTVKELYPGTAARCAADLVIAKAKMESSLVILGKTKEYVRSDLTQLREYVQLADPDFGTHSFDENAKQILWNDDPDQNHQTLFQKLYEELYNLHKTHDSDQITNIMAKTASFIRIPDGMRFWEGKLVKERFFDRDGNEI
jgi:hypothetical protein